MTATDINITLTDNQQRLYNMLTMSHMFTKLNAGNDYNGNPRRVWVISSEDGKPLFAYDEGYLGRDCVPGRVRRAFDYAPCDTCTLRQYQMLIKLPHPDYLPEDYINTTLNF